MKPARIPMGDMWAGDSQEPVDLVSSLLAAESPEATMAAGARLLAAVSGARFAAVFLLQGHDVVGEAWHPSDSAPAGPIHARMTSAAMAGSFGAITLPASDNSANPAAPGDNGAAGGNGGIATFVPKESCGWIVAACPLAVGGRLVGTAAMAWPGGNADHDPRREVDIETAAGILACRLALQVETSRFEIQKNQYERWFKTLDDQLRVLDRERQKFASVVNHTDVCVFVVDTSRTVGWTNNVLPLKFPPPQEGSGWVGRTSCELCATMESDRRGNCPDCPIRRAIAENSVSHREIRMVREGGDRNLYLTAVPIKGPDGRPHEVIVSIQDLTDLDVLRQSERRYRDLFEQSSNAILMIDPDSWRIVLANDTAARLVKFSPEDLTLLGLSALHTDMDWPVLKQEYSRLLDGDGGEGLECRLLTRDGNECVAAAQARHFDLGGRRLMLLELRDLTGRRRAEEALKAAEERLHTVVANAPLVFFSIDKNHCFTLSEGKGLEGLGLRPGEVVGRRLEDVYSDHPDILANIQRALDGEEFIGSACVGDLTYETWYAPLREDGGDVSGMVGVATDVTRSRSLEDQLRQSQKMEAVGRLAGGVAHDFNNLLTIILGNCGLLTQGLEPGSRGLHEAQMIEKAGTRGAMLARQLLAFSRRELVTPRVLDLNAVVSEIEPMLQRLIGEDIDLVTVHHGSPVWARTDAGQMEQVLLNLAVNARDAMPQGGKLTIEAALMEVDEALASQHLELVPGPYATLAVSDEGCGMDAHTLAHLFDPFFTTKPTDKGTGLGMSIVFGIVRQSGGDVHAHSEPGRGTTIRVFLPQVAESDPGVERVPEAARPRDGTETILVVEDQEEVRDLACEILEMNGYTVLRAACAEEALQICESFKNPIDLMLSDVVMPGMGGGELAGRLSRTRPDLKVMFMSGYTDDDVVRHGVRSREQAFIQKPFTIEALTRTVRRTLDAPPGMGGKAVTADG